MRLHSTLLLLPLFPLIPAQAQFRSDWVTVGNDAQRSSWVRADAKISPESMAKPGFEFLWKMKFPNTPRQMNSLTAPVLMNQLIGYRGFRALAFVGGSDDKVFVVDTDIARNEWDKAVTSAPAQRGTPECPGGLTSSLARGSTAGIPPIVPAGPGRGSAAASAVGDPGQGAVTLAASLARQRPAIPTPPPSAAPPKPQQQLPVDRRGGVPVFVLSSSGMLHSLNVHNGADVQPGTKFLPANANAAGLLIVDNHAYAVTTSNCGGAPAGVWALDLATGKVANWISKAGVAGTSGIAMAGDGSVFVATKGGDIVHLEAGTLRHLATYGAPDEAFTSSPVVFEHKGKTIVGAVSAQGHLHLVDGANMARISEPAAFSTKPDFNAGALATWQDDDGVRWVLAPSATAIVAWKVTDRNGTPAVEKGWTSRALDSPIPPMIVNGIVFAASAGDRSTPATLYALDGKTGKELWNSGKSITSFVQGGGFAGAAGQVYLPTYDGTLYAFGFPIEH